MAKPLLGPTGVEALTRPTQTTLEALIDEFGLRATDLLSAVADVQSRLDAWDIECEPQIGQGALDQPRVLSRKKVDDLESLLESDIQRGEGASIEFKETLYLDARKHRFSGRPVRECGSEEVLHSAMKTVCAFLNTDGGVLLIGVSDGGEKVGIEREFELTGGVDRQNFDAWELFFRRKLDQMFVDGRSVSSSIAVQRVEIAEKFIARIVVGSRKALSFLKTEKGELTFIRTGNRTLSIQYSDIEKYFDLSKKYL